MNERSRSDRIRVGVLGASGYTGAEMLRLLAHHPQAEVGVLTAERHAGRPVGEVFPHLAGLSLPNLVKIADVDWSALDAVFCCLPHAATQEIVAGLPDRLRIVDLSADFRLADVQTYERWYGRPHAAPHLQKRAVYGLTELARADIRGARLVASPGCYPTAALLPLVPALEAGVIDADDIVIDAKSGVSGAGRALRESMLYGEVAEAVHAYAVAGHRHAPEIEQEVSRACGRQVVVTFTPHLMPMNRGILATIYVRLADGASPESLRRALVDRYRGEAFVRVVPEGVSPATRHVRGSNYCLIAVFPDRRAGRAILVAVIDNLVKGASGQAIQSFNVMHDLPETAGLEQEPLFP